MKVSERECFRQGTTAKPASGTRPQANRTHALGVSARTRGAGRGRVPGTGRTCCASAAGGTVEMTDARSRPGFYGRISEQETRMADDRSPLTADPRHNGSVGADVAVPERRQGFVAAVGRQIAARLPAADLSERDPDYIRRPLPGLWLLASYYFRADVRGLHHVPEQGPVLLVGNHSGGNVPADTFVFTLAFSAVLRGGSAVLPARAQPRDGVAGAWFPAPLRDDRCGARERDARARHGSCGARLPRRRLRDASSVVGVCACRLRSSPWFHRACAGARAPDRAGRRPAAA